jgi:hypothetical protein
MIRNQQPAQQRQRRRRPPPRIQSTQEFSVTRKCFVQIPLQQLILMQKRQVVGVGVGVGVGSRAGGDDRNSNNSHDDDVITEENNNEIVYWPGILVKDLGQFSNLIRQKMDTVLRQLKGGDNNNNSNNNNKEKYDKYGIELEKEIFHAATSSSRSGIFLFGRIQFNTSNNNNNNNNNNKQQQQQQKQHPIISYVVPYGVYPIDFCCSNGTGTGTDINKIWDKVDIVDGYVEALQESLEFWKLYSVRSSVGNGNDDKLYNNEVIENNCNYEKDDISIDSSSSSSNESSSSDDDDDDDDDRIVSPSRSNSDETSSTMWVETQRKQDENNAITKLSSTSKPSSSITMVVETPQKQIEESSSLMEQNMCGEQNNETHNTTTATTTKKEPTKKNSDTGSDDTQNEQGGKKVIPEFLDDDDDDATTKQRQTETDAMEMIEEERRCVETKRKEVEKNTTRNKIEATETKAKALDDEEKRKQIEAEQQLQAEEAAATMLYAKGNTNKQQVREARPAVEAKSINDDELKAKAVTGLVVKQTKQRIDAVDANAKANAEEEEAAESKKRNTTSAEAIKTRTQEEERRIEAQEILQNPDIETNAESKKNPNSETTNSDNLPFRVYPDPESRPCINSINTSKEQKTKQKVVPRFSWKMKINDNESQEHCFCKTRSRGGIGKIIKINFPDKKLGLLIVDKFKTLYGMNINDMPHGTGNGGLVMVSGFTGCAGLSRHKNSYTKVNIGDELLSIGDTNVQKESLRKIVGLISTSSRPLQIRFLRRKNTINKLNNNKKAKKKKTTDSTAENHNTEIIAKSKTPDQERSTAVTTSSPKESNDNTTKNPNSNATAKSKTPDQERGTAVPTSSSNESHDDTTGNPDTNATAKSKTPDQERGYLEKNRSSTTVPTSSPNESKEDTTENSNTTDSAKSNTPDQERAGPEKNQSSTAVPTSSPNESKDEDNVELDCMMDNKKQGNEVIGYWDGKRRNEYKSQYRCHLHKKGKCLNCDCCWKCDPPPFCSKDLHFGKKEFCSKDLHIGKMDAKNSQRKRSRSSSSSVGIGGPSSKKSKGASDKVQGSVIGRLSKTTTPDKTKLEPKSKKDMDRMVYKKCSLADNHLNLYFLVSACLCNAFIYLSLSLIKADCNDGEDWLYKTYRYQVIKKIPTFTEVKQTLEEGGHSFRNGLFTVPLGRGKVEVFSSENAYREYLCRNGVTLKGVSDRDASRERKYMILAAWVCYQRVEKLLGASIVPIYYTELDIHSNWKQTLAKLGFHRSSTGRWTIPRNKEKIEDFGLTHILAQEGIPEYLVQECNMTRDDHILLELHSSCPFRRLIHYPFFQKIN